MFIQPSTITSNYSKHNKHIYDTFMENADTRLLYYWLLNIDNRFNDFYFHWMLCLYCYIVFYT